ncbi:hypothetical protein PG999_005451 [Apiospora kogelbergensis]|uniref:MADS-box domain-containing protein n=1 Tax=Apiospora kogelbergensis TaxID=1337665 RepID=A0AAW0R254_9PEZI
MTRERDAKTRRFGARKKAHTYCKLFNGDDAVVLFRTAKGEWHTYESSGLLAAFIDTLGVRPKNRWGPDDFDLVKEREGSQLPTTSSFVSHSSSSASSSCESLLEESFSSAAQGKSGSTAQRSSIPGTPLLGATSASLSILPSLESPLFLDSDPERPVTPTRALLDRWSPSPSVSTPTAISPRRLDGRITRSEPPAQPVRSLALRTRSPRAIRRRATTGKLPVRLQNLDYFK